MPWPGPPIAGIDHRVVDHVDDRAGCDHRLLWARRASEIRSKDTAAFRDVFEPNAKLIGMRTRQNGEQVVQVLPWDRFGAFMASDTRGPWIERAWSPEVRIRGTLATVWAEYDFHFGQTPSHCGVDAVQLLKTPGGWKIVSIADTYEPTGCPTREPPR